MLVGGYETTQVIRVLCCMGPGNLGFFILGPQHALYTYILPDKKQITCMHSLDTYMPLWPKKDYMYVQCWPHILVKL